MTFSVKLKALFLVGFTFSATHAGFGDFLKKVGNAVKKVDNVAKQATQHVENVRNVARQHSETARELAAQVGVNVPGGNAGGGDEGDPFDDLLDDDDAVDDSVDDPSQAVQPRQSFPQPNTVSLPRQQQVPQQVPQRFRKEYQMGDRAYNAGRGSVENVVQNRQQYQNAFNSLKNDFQQARSHGGQGGFMGFVNQAKSFGENIAHNSNQFEGAFDNAKGNISTTVSNWQHHNNAAPQQPRRPQQAAPQPQQVSPQMQQFSQVQLHPQARANQIPHQVSQFYTQPEEDDFDFFGEPSPSDESTFGFDEDEAHDDDDFDLFGSNESEQNPGAEAADIGEDFLF